MKIEIGVDEKTGAATIAFDGEPARRLAKFKLDAENEFEEDEIRTRRNGYLCHRPTGVQQIVISATTVPGRT